MRVKEESEKADLKLKTFKKLKSWHLVPSIHHQYTGKQWKVTRLYFLGLQKSLQMVTAAMKLKDTCSLEEKL